ncbi:MAG: FapA family protein [Treponema sp.]|jgi:uncharacterized protein (DUF342 family)|nr:FapA family protein [Treponema sp.]
MTNLAGLQQVLKERLEQDRGIRMVEASGPTLEIAVSEAATLLDIPVRRLEYEVAERGFNGFLGTVKKDWKIRAYERARRQKKDRHTAVLEEIENTEPEVSNDRDGEAFVQLRPEGAFLKVVPPEGEGERIADAHAMEALNSREVQDIDEELVSKVVAECAGIYVRVGDFEHQSANSSTVMVDVSGDEMKVYIRVTPPGKGGSDLPFETYISYLRSHNVVHGIKEDFLRDFADKPVYKEAVLAAEGTRAVDGRDAYIRYNFETDQSRVRIREGANGKVDFKELNIIQNVVENQPLAKAMLPEMGTVGRTVTGKNIPAKNGRDISLPLGENVRVAEDEVTILANINGQVMLTNGKINVQPIYTVKGDVNLKTGNIIFLGTVIITGSVDDGFSVKATGNIEVHGTVDKAELDAEGDIIVNQGINGKGAGSVRAGRSVWARFIENTHVEAGNMVSVADGIINSQVDAAKRIVCQGKRAHIVGGKLRAAEDINAKILGSPVSGTETILEVGFDPQSKAELERFGKIRNSSRKELEEIRRNLKTLINIKKERKSLPEDKEADMQDLIDRRDTLMKDYKRAEEKIAKVQQRLEQLKVRGRVSASSKVYPGVKIVIRDTLFDVRSEYRTVTFVLENELIQVSPYEESDVDLKQEFDGYTTD